MPQVDGWSWVRRAWGAIGRAQGAWPAAPAPLVGHPADERLDPLRHHLRQRSSTTCGSASLLVARALADPAFAAQLLLGRPDDGRAPATGGRGAVAARFAADGEHGAGEPDHGGTTDQADDLATRFGSAERAVMRRTNGLVGPTGLQVPWPQALGTPPWGAAHEMTRITGRRYRARCVGPDSPTARAAGYDAVERTVAAGRTAPMFVGDGASPRHVVLAVGHDDDALHLYEPASGEMVTLPRDQYVDGGFVVAGWTVPWAVVVPR